MKITLNWLKQYVDFSGSPEELAERLTMLGIEVEGVQKSGGEFEGSSWPKSWPAKSIPTPTSSRSVASPMAGERQIVCGAKNYAVGDKVPLILPGHTLPAGLVSSRSSIRAGQAFAGSNRTGMLCSPQELGLPDSVDGLLILPESRPKSVNPLPSTWAGRESM